MLSEQTEVERKRAALAAAVAEALDEIDGRPAPPRRRKCARCGIRLKPEDPSGEMCESCTDSVAAGATGGRWSDSDAARRLTRPGAVGVQCVRCHRRRATSPCDECRVALANDGTARVDEPTAGA